MSEPTRKPIAFADIARAFNREIDAANAAMAAKEAELDQFGYGGDPARPRGPVVGLDAFIPRSRR